MLYFYSVKKTKIRNIIILVVLSVTLLICVQFYWIYSLIILEKERFENSARDAVVAAVEKIEKKETASMVIRNLPSHFEFKNIHIPDPPGIDSVKIPPIPYFQNYVSDSTRVRLNVNLRKMADSVRRSIRTNPYKFILPEKKDKLVEKVVEELEFMDKKADIFQRIDSAGIESNIKASLEERGLEGDFLFGIKEESGRNFRLISGKADPEKLKESKIKVRLFPADIFGEPYFISVYFPTKLQHILRNVSSVLLLSVIVIILISFAFYKSIRYLLLQKKYSEIKQDLMNNITHEFKTPIATISLAAETLSEPVLAENETSRLKYLEIIKEENSRLKNLVEKVLNAAVMEKEAYHLNRQVTDICAIIQSASERFKVSLSENGGRIDILRGTETHLVFGDRFHLENVFSNIFDNSLKYNTNIPEIKAVIKVEGEKIAVSVEDNGTGISKENLSRVFETFFREQTGNIHNVKGFGIGLSYVKEIVNLHGGEIKLESRKGKGTKITLTFNPVQNEG